MALRLLFSLWLILAWIAPTATLDATRGHPRAIARRGGSDASAAAGDASDGLFANEPSKTKEEEATERYAQAVEAARKSGGAGPALDAFEAESLKPDRNESLLVVHWIDVKLESLCKKKPADFAGAFNASHPFARGVLLLATECGAYLEAEKIAAPQFEAFCGRCAAAVGLEAPAFTEQLSLFEANLAAELSTGVKTRLAALTEALADDGFSEKALASLTERKSKLLEMVGDVEKIEELRRDMRKNLDEVGEDPFQQAALVQQLVPAVETLLGSKLPGAPTGE